ncbi:MAG: hypothetical protein HDR01_10295 [Lachnospiraceae bacterium]|nr:hypothetical protein [Lachnospiraceae bacterium]
MRKKMGLFFLLIKSKIKFLGLFLIIYVFIIPLFMAFLKSMNSIWNYTELIVKILYQIFYVIFSGISYILFMQDLVEEEGREVFYINKRMYLMESFVFTVITCVLLQISINILGFWNPSIKECALFVIIENILVLGILYFILYSSHSSAVATAVMLCLLIGSLLSDNLYLSVIVPLGEDYKRLLYQAFIQTGYAIIFWSLGGIVNVFYSKFE